MPSRRSTARDLAHIAIFAALIAALGLPGTIQIGVSPVPITLQTLGVMLAGAILGARKGFLSVAVFELLTLAGLPLLAGGRGGVQWFTVSPSAGYMYGWLAGAAVIGALTRRLLPRYPLWLGIGATIVGGIVVVYALGVPWTAFRVDLSLWAAIADAAKFLPGDLLKAVVAAVIAKQVHRAYPGLIRTARSPKGPAATPSSTPGAGPTDADHGIGAR